MDLEGINFNGTVHQKFFLENMEKCRYNDVFHEALIYCLGISQDTRNHIGDIFGFKTDSVKPECLTSDWITRDSAKIIRLAYNLYNNGLPFSFYDTDMPSVCAMEQDNKKLQDILNECQKYTVDNIFNCSYAPYFIDAVKIRYRAFFQDFDKCTDNV